MVSAFSWGFRGSLHSPPNSLPGPAPSLRGRSWGCRSLQSCWGLPTIRKGLYAIRLFTLNINFLMTIAVVGACAIGEWPEAAMVVFLFAVAERIEVYSLDRARNAVRSLMEMAPEVASMKQPDGSWREMPAAEVPPGSILRVRPGERLGLDGVVISGVSAVNQRPSPAKACRSIKAPATCSSPARLTATDCWSSAQRRPRRHHDCPDYPHRPGRPGQPCPDPAVRRSVRADLYADRVRGGRLDRGGSPLMLDQPFMPWIYKALVVLVIACPCALVISTPVTVVTGLSAAARQGILIKGARIWKREESSKSSRWIRRERSPRESRS